MATGLWPRLKFALQEVTFKIMVIGRLVQDLPFLDLRGDRPDYLPENIRVVATARIQAVMQRGGSVRLSRNMHGSH